MPQKIAILMTVHNRKDETLVCLRSLYACVIPENYDINIFLVNDGSTDGTEIAVIEKFPQVKIIQGNGNLFWNRGMRLAWETASNTFDYDYYCWLNDDVILNQHAIIELIESSQKKSDNAIICGTTSSSDGETITYGGRLRRIGIVKPNGEMQPCDCCNGQICLIPKSVYKIMGMNDPIFHHGFGDWDYGFRAKKQGFDIYVAPSISGICDVNLNDEFPKYLNPKVSLFKRFQILYSPLGKNPIQFFIYTYRHKSLRSALISFVLSHIKVSMISLNNIFKK